jgi:hypothetical protein
MKGRRLIMAKDHNFQEGTRPERVPFSTRIDKKLIKSIKMIALEEDKEVYVTLEEALEKFIQGKEALKSKGR